jgi:hypothetical protein
MRDDGAEEAGFEVDDCAHEQSSGAAAFGSYSGRVSVAFVEQVVRDGDEVGEGVALVHEASGVVPGLAHVSAAADVGVGEDESAIEQAEAVAAEGDGQRIAIGPVSVNEERILAVLE